MYKTSIRTFKVTPEQDKFLLENKMNWSRFYRFIIDAIRTQDEEIISKLEELMHTRIDEMTRHIEYETHQHAKPWPVRMTPTSLKLNKVNTRF